MNRSPLRRPGWRDPVLWGSLWLGVSLLAILLLAVGCLASIGAPGGQPSPPDVSGVGNPPVSRR
ncbi:hypothetical protein [Actinorugispora endophytica]|uniref:Uncharacterized protein n=1 Tax=Actinorugispora endophytica TaxID=1605990 RepID=A0A4R6UUX6_9ACTN|nr:hypothetical protein [Actinorugispora endophytica]TDQ49205.1 hypothetical protein EV190_1161 [Actinorugispora endophytica]